MSSLFDPALLETIHTLGLASVVLSAAGLSLWALPWSDHEISQVHSTFQASTDLSQDSLPLQTLG
jgi:hypothetical protein